MGINFAKGHRFWSPTIRLAFLILLVKFGGIQDFIPKKRINFVNSFTLPLDYE